MAGLQVEIVRAVAGLAGADEALDEAGRTALYMAALNGHVVRVLSQLSV